MRVPSAVFWALPFLLVRVALPYLPIVLFPSTSPTLLPPPPPHLSSSSVAVG